MKDSIKNIVFDSAENGIITSGKITELGLHRSVLQELLVSGEIIQNSRGIYTMADEWEDEYSILQHKYRRGIYSHETALYLLGYSERIPLNLHMTFPSGYNSAGVKKDNIIVTRVIEENYAIGLAVVKSPYDNEVYAYDLERSLCDVLRGNRQDIQTVQYAMKKYAVSKDKDINKLMTYAERLRVTSKVRKYMEILL